MRFALLLLAALGVFLGGYLALAWLMPDPQPSAQRGVRAVVPELRQSQRVIGDIDGVTLRTHDPKTGAPVAQVEIGEYRRSGEHQVLLREIEATILLEQGSGLVRISAPTGTVDLEAEVEQQDRLTAEALGTADVARLKDVTIRWYDDPAAIDKGPAGARLTLRVDNLVYDNNQFSLFTDDTEIDGATVLADDVPVEVRGRDYDFDGRGLLVRWDAQTRRPVFLRVAHGERLAIKTERGFMPTRIVGGAGDPGRVMLASADPRAITQALAGDQAPMHLYRATMQQNLRAQQGGLTKLEASSAVVHFAMDASDADAGTPAAATSRAAPQTAPAPREPEKPFEPITLLWDGGLLIEAVDPSGDDQLASADDLRLQLEGTPLVMREEGVEARGQRLDYLRDADEMAFSGTADFPVTLVEAGGSTLVTGRLLAHPNAGTARAPGAGYTEVATGDGQALQLRWEKECDFTFEEIAGGGRHLKSVAARGNVAVRHPDVRLDSEVLDAVLGPRAGSDDPQLQSVFAEGSVRCELSGDEPTSFESDRLKLTLEEGLEGPITALVEGNVRSLQSGQRLNSNQLEVKLAPDAQDQLVLVELTARGNVHGGDDQGRTYGADVLRATPLAPPAGAADGDARQAISVRLEGVDGRLATVEIGADKLLAPALEFNSRDESVHTPGAGEMRTQQTGPGGRSLPVIMTWAGSMTGTRRLVEIAGDVRLKGQEEPANDSRLTTDIDLRAGQAKLQLKETLPDAPGEPQVAGDPTTRPAELAAAVEQITLSGGLHATGLHATVEERDGQSLLRSFDLRSEALDAWPGEKSVRVVIDCPGRVLFRDLRPPSTAGPATRPGADGFRGNAAVEWARRLGFDPETGLLQLAGGVSLAVEPLTYDEAGQAKPARVFRLEADEATVQTTQTADGRAEMRSAAATGSARFSTEGLSFEGGEIKFDPGTGRITARGAGGAPVVVFDADGVPTGRFAEVVYNLETGQIERLLDLGAGG